MTGCHSSDVPQRNMFLMKKEYFDRYCEFLFNILFEVEKYVKLSPYAYYRRVFGFMGEMLLPLFCYHNKLKTQRRYIVYIDNNGKNKSDMFYTVKYILYPYTSFLFFLISHLNLMNCLLSLFIQSGRKIY